jgi:protein O-mannosyl-transferase
MDNKALFENSKSAKGFPSPIGNALEENRKWAGVFLWLSVLLTLLAYLPLMNNQFVDWDDTLYIQYNTHIRDLHFSSLLWMFTNFYGGYWIPLTWLSLALDYGLGRLEPWVYHLDNLVLHLLNTAVVFLLSSKILTLIQKNRSQDNKKRASAWLIPASFLTALLFGIHPIHVESVAWATERKDLLCGLFSFLSLSAYLDYASQFHRSPQKYLACGVFFILALLSKPMAVSLPFVFILLDYWPLGRFHSNVRKVLAEKIPFFVLALLSSVVAVWTQFGAGAGWGLDQSPLSFRLTNSCHSILFYLVKMLAPVHLTTFYPIRLENTFSLEYLLSVLGVVLVSLFCFINRKKRPYLVAAWLYYLVTLAPALGIVQVGNQAAGDRFTYLPSLGPCLLAASAFVAFFSRKFLILFLLGAGWVALLGFGTFRQVSVWKDSISLWENVLRIYPDNNLIVHNNLGKAYEEAGRWDDALAKFEDAAYGTTPFFHAHWGKARILADKGLWEESLQEYKTAIAMNPQFPPLYSGLGMVYGKKKLWPEALVEVQKAIQMDPRYADAYDDLGVLYRDQAQYGKSIEALQNARALDPNNVVYLRNLLKTYQQAGHYKEAMLLYRDLSDHPRSLLTMNY